MAQRHAVSIIIIIIIIIIIMRHTIITTPHCDGHKHHHSLQPSGPLKVGWPNGTR
jgi:hypothetical protein